MYHRLPAALLLLAALPLSAQFDLEYDPSAQVTVGGSPLAMPWAGAVNFSQWSNLDIDADGDQDLFCFDRSGNEVMILENLGSGSSPNHRPTRAYDQVYPLNELHDWALLRDYNCDGKPDIFSYSLGGCRVFKNTSVGGNLSFQLVTNLVLSNYQPTMSNLYITQVDVPGIEDIDYDGDLDFITFSIFGSYLEYHRNLSMELYGTCDSLKFEIRNRCWGYFSESAVDNSVNLDDSCDYNVPNPEMPPAPTQASLLSVRDERTTPPVTDDDAVVMAYLRSAAHVGSTITPIDLNGDTVRDLLLGDVIFSNITALFNDGSVDDNHMGAQDAQFPSYDTPIALDIFPGCYYVNVDGDADRDLIVGVNSTSLANNFDGVWYYKNNGTDAAPVFDFQSVDLFQRDMIETGEGAYPVLFDHNGDGLMDILISNYGYYVAGGNYTSKIALLQNTGTTTQPSFALVTTDYAGLGGLGLGQALHPAFTDLDGDGDKDMVLGELQGKLFRFLNNPSGGVANFNPAFTVVNNDLGAGIDVGQFSKPYFFDVDGDSKTDLLVGERNGNVNYYRNTGTSASPVWHLENDSLGNVVVKEWWNVTGYSVPLMFINDDGDRELLVGSESGWIWDFGNIDGNLNGTFTLLDSTWNDIKEGSNSSLVLHDFNGDGARDVVTGNYRGGLGYWRNDFNVSTQSGDGLSAGLLFTLVPNPAAGATELVLAVPLGNTAELTVLDATGRLVHARPLRDRRTLLDTGRWSKGVYTVRITDAGRSWSQRLVIVR